jgi:hypothetical protein
MLVPGQGFAVGATVVRVLATAGATRLAIDEPPSPPPPPLPPEPPPPLAETAAHDSAFAREVRATLAQAPWYLVSLLLHVAFLLLMSLVETEQRAPERVAHIAVAPPKDEAEPDLPPDAPLSLADHEEEKIEDLLVFEEPPAAQRSLPNSAEAADYEDLTHAEALGTGDGRRPVTRLKKPLATTKTKGGEKALDKGALDAEQGRATDEVKRGLGDGLREARQRLSKEHIVVVRGAHDKIEAVLDGYEWPYTLTTREDLLLRGAGRARILFVNCSNPPPPAQAAKIGALVKRLLGGGCWVVTSDWSVYPYLTEAFPTIVTSLGSPRSQRNTTVVVEPGDEDDALLAGVFPRRGGSEWWLEDSSTMVAVTDRATTLVASEDMRGRYGSPVVAFKFPFGNGVVVHLVGHFYQEDGNVHGLVAMHRLINNVILERVRAGH